jgi:hypothetical protein
VASGNWSPGEPLLRAFESARAWSRVFQSSQDLALSQARLGENIAMVSPASLLSQALAAVVDSGVGHYAHFLASSRRYRQELESFLDLKYPLKKALPLDRDTTDPIVSAMRLDFDSIPKFEDRFASVRQAAPRWLACLGWLLLVNLALFSASLLSFLRYDVR